LRGEIDFVEVKKEFRKQQTTAGVIPQKVSGQNFSRLGKS
jgi:hypothetical protein